MAGVEADWLLAAFRRTPTDFFINYYALLLHRVDGHIEWWSTSRVVVLTNPVHRTNLVLRVGRNIYGARFDPPPSLACRVRLSVRRRTAAAGETFLEI